MESWETCRKRECAPAWNQSAQTQKCNTHLSRALSRVNVSVEEGSAKDPATARDYRGMLPDVLAILNENTRLRGEVVRLRAENARLKMAAER